MADCIEYKDIAYYSDLILAYLAQDDHLKYAYHHFPTLQNFKKQLEEKGANFSIETRQTLVTSLQKQYAYTAISEATQHNIELLSDKKTFTITTGHQLNLFTGPLYFLYKIISVIKLTQQLKAAYPAYNFVPIYWMASEDHDFEEINYFNFEDQKLRWESSQAGAVGRFSTQGLDAVFNEFDQKLNDSDAADYLRQCFKKAYLEHDNLTEATRYLASEFLGKYGLVIVDGDDRELKRLFAPYVKDELLGQTAFKQVTNTAHKLAEQGYKVQVNPREINLFYLADQLRERLVVEGYGYAVNDTELRFTTEELLTELDNYPERFSPNAIMRPLYQEVILPNLCYVGGSGELAYWLELKAYFETVKVDFPMLLLRNSAVLLSEKQNQKRQKLELSFDDLFLPQVDLRSKKTKELSAIRIDFSQQKDFLKQQFADLYTLAKATDKSFIGAVAAQEKKQLNGLNHLEKRLLKAQKRHLKADLERLTDLQDELFPNHNLQERTVNFSEFYQVYGQDLIDQLFATLEPLQLHFDCITLK